MAKDSNKIMAEPGTLLTDSKYCMLAVMGNQFLITDGSGLMGQACRLNGFSDLASHRLRVRPGTSCTFEKEVGGRRMLQRALSRAMLLLFAGARGYVGKVQGFDP